MIYYSQAQQTFFDDQIHDSVPDDAQAITDEQHQQLLDALNYGHAIADDLTVHPRPSAAHTWQPASQTWVLDTTAQAQLFQAAKTAKLAALNQAAQNYINQIAGIDKLPQFEVDTWTLQALEAKAWAADKTAPTPTLDTIAAARGIDPNVLKQKALEKAQKFEQLTATVVGMRQAIETRINRATDIDELNAIEFAFGES